mgnify:CR=1 FL=1
MGLFPINSAHRDGHWLALVLSLATNAATAAPTAPELLQRGDAAGAAPRFAEQARDGRPVAQNNLGVLYQRGQGVPRDYAQARAWFEKAAAQGLPGAMYNMGMLYLRGYGVPVDATRAAAWLEKAAALEEPEAQFYLGLLHYRGEGVPKDLAVAAYWFEKAAAAGVTEARYNLALMLARGEGVPVDETRALALLEPFATTRDDAALLVAEIHLRHVEEPARAAQALAVFRRLAESGVADAKSALAMMYVMGTGTPVDVQEGRFWMEQAARQGIPSAQLNLAGFYAQGIGAERDLSEAHAWYTLSAENGETGARAFADAVANELDTDGLLRAATRLGELRALTGAGGGR